MFLLVNWSGRGGASTPLIPGLATTKEWLMTESSTDPQRRAARLIEIAIARAVAAGAETITEMAHQSAKLLAEKGLLADGGDA